MIEFDNKNFDKKNFDIFFFSKFLKKNVEKIKILNRKFWNSNPDSVSELKNMIVVRFYCQNYNNFPVGRSKITRHQCYNVKLILTRTKCADQKFNVLTHLILLIHQYLDPPTPSGDPLGIGTSCRVLFLGIRITGKVLPARFQVLSGIGDPWIGHVCWRALQTRQ